MNNSYGIYPFEPTLFNTKLSIKVNDQLPDIKAVEPLFAGFLLDTSMDAKTVSMIQFLEKVKSDNSISLRVKDLNSYDVSDINGKLTVSVSLNDNTFDSIQRLLQTKLMNNPNFEFLELRDVNSIVKLVSFLGKVNIPNVSIHSNTNLQDLMNTAFSVKPHSLNFDQFGICASEQPKLNDLYNYYIDNEKLLSISNKLDPIRLHISETDSICETTDKITNTFGSALWLLDYLFQVAKGNIHRVYVKLNNANYYGLLAFSYATRNNAVFYDYDSTYGVQVKPNISIYVTKNLKEYNVIVIHKDITQENVQVSVTLPVASPGLLVRLISNQTDVGSSGITFGEYTFDSGVLKDVGMSHNDSVVHGPVVKPENNTYTFIINRLSAAVLTVPIELSGGAFFENINDSDEIDTVVTVRPDSREPDSIPMTMSLSEFEKNYL